MTLLEFVLAALKNIMLTIVRIRNEYGPNPLASMKMHQRILALYNSGIAAPAFEAWDRIRSSYGILRTRLTLAWETRKAGHRASSIV